MGPAATAAWGTKARSMAYENQPISHINQPSRRVAAAAKRSNDRADQIVPAGGSIEVMYQYRLAEEDVEP